MSQVDRGGQAEAACGDEGEFVRVSSGDRVEDVVTDAGVGKVRWHADSSAQLLDLVPGSRGRVVK